MSTYEVLTNPKNVEVAWVDVPNWRDLPSSAFTTLSPVETCNQNVVSCLFGFLTAHACITVFTSRDMP